MYYQYNTSQKWSNTDHVHDTLAVQFCFCSKTALAVSTDQGVL
jgi:hypothetical protein